MADTTEYQCEICSENVTLHESDPATECPVCGLDELVEV